MDIEKLIRRLRNDADAYRNGKTLGRAFADQEDVLDNAATAISTLQAENEKLRAELEQVKREKDAAVECCRGYCESCAFERDCAKHDMNDAAPTRWYYGDCEDWEWRGPEEG